MTGVDDIFRLYPYGSVAYLVVVFFNSHVHPVCSRFRSWRRVRLCGTIDLQPRAMAKDSGLSLRMWALREPLTYHCIEYVFGERATVAGVSLDHHIPTSFRNQDVFVRTRKPQNESRTFLLSRVLMCLLRCHCVHRPELFRSMVVICALRWRYQIQYL